MDNAGKAREPKQRNTGWLLAIWAMCVLLAFINGRVVGVIGSGLTLGDELAQALGSGIVIYFVPFLFLLIPIRLYKSWKYKSTAHLLVLVD